MTDRFDPPLPEDDETTTDVDETQTPDEAIVVDPARDVEAVPEPEAAIDPEVAASEPAANDSRDVEPDLADIDPSIVPFDADEAVPMRASLPPPPADAADEFTRWQRATGAFVLGALEPDEAPLATRQYAQSEELQAELRVMLPVADILTGLYSSQPAPGATTPVSAATSGAATQVAVPPQVDARQPRTTTRPVVIPASQQRSTSPILLGALGVLAALGFLWALAQRDQLATRDTEIDALRTRVAELSVAGNANVFVLNPASEAGSGAKATIFYSPGDGTVLLDARGLPELEEDRVYQVWFAAAGTDAWRAGPIFTVNQSGDAVRRLPGDVTDFGRMAISDEPAPGSTDAPDEFLLLGELVVATQ